MDVFVFICGDLLVVWVWVWVILEYFLELVLIFVVKKDLFISVDVDFFYMVIIVDGFWVVLWSDSGEI